MKDYYPGNLGGNDKRFVRSQRGYDSPLTKDMSGNQQRRNGYHRKKSGPDINTEVFNEALKAIKERLHHISETQDRMAALQERSTVAEERQAEAMEQVAVYLKQLLVSSSGSAMEDIKSENSPETGETVEVEGNSVLETVMNMRDKGITFGNIADHLNAENIPTVSGADQWNRLTVSKFYKEAVE